ncbi:hypothetical protein [Prosthecobacter algae]|uniref:hypothetical protein n=1 Tax=Prosthecobacter algae TaxID=1144682 RepID=UPI0031EAAFCC
MKNLALDQLCAGLLIFAAGIYFGSVVFSAIKHGEIEVKARPYKKSENPLIFAVYTALAFLCCSICIVALAVKAIMILV